MSLKTLLISGGVAACVVVAACAVSTTQSAFADTSGVDVDIDGITGLDVSAGMRVEYEVSDVYAVELELRRGDIDDVRIERKGDTLHIGRENKGWMGWGDSVEATITVLGPNLTEIDVSSGSSTQVEGLSGDDLEIDSSSGSSLRVSGTCEDLEAGASSGASVNASNLTCKLGNLDTSSGASLAVTVTDLVNADASSGSSISVQGGARSGDIDSSSGASVAVAPAKL
ncbi:MAG: DUF2807 domain-containing protein [Pseudomonadota bacterium]